MSMHTYIGARYVPRFLGTYDPTQSYETLDVVDNGTGTSYIARIPTPAGTPLTNTDHWFLYGAAGGAIINLQNQIDALNARTVKHYDTVAAMDADSANLLDGDTVETAGYYSIGDGGAALYYIGTTTYGVHSETLSSGLYASIINNDVNLKQLGASTSNTDSANAAIIKAWIDNPIPGMLTIPFDIKYGYDNHDSTTFPNFSDCTTRKYIEDYSIDQSYPLTPYTERAMQERHWSFTPDPDDGIHDGNIFGIYSNWHPNIFLATMNPGGAIPNRASIFFGQDNDAKWRLGMGKTDTDRKFIVAKIGDDNTITTRFEIDHATGYVGIGDTGALPYKVTMPNPTFVDDGTTLLHFMSSYPANTADFWMRLVRVTNALRLIVGSSTALEYNYSDQSKTLYNVGTAGGHKLDIDYTDNTVQTFRFGGGYNLLVNEKGNARWLFRIEKAGAFQYGVGAAHTTAGRPTDVAIGTMTFDTTLGKPIWFKGGSTWVDATGASV